MRVFVLKCAYVCIKCHIHTYKWCIYAYSGEGVIVCAPVNGSLQMLACKYEMRSFSYFSFISFQSSFYYFYSTQNLDDTTCISFLGFRLLFFALSY